MTDRSILSRVHSAMRVVIESQTPRHIAYMPMTLDRRIATARRINQQIVAGRTAFEIAVTDSFERVVAVIQHNSDGVALQTGNRPVHMFVDGGWVHVTPGRDYSLSTLNWDASQQLQQALRERRMPDGPTPSEAVDESHTDENGQQVVMQTYETGRCVAPRRTIEPATAPPASNYIQPLEVDPVAQPSRIRLSWLSAERLEVLPSEAILQGTRRMDQRGTHMAFRLPLGEAEIRTCVAELGPFGANLLVNMAQIRTMNSLVITGQYSLCLVKTELYTWQELCPEIIVRLTAVWQHTYREQPTIVCDGIDSSTPAATDEPPDERPLRHFGGS